MWEYIGPGDQSAVVDDHLSEESMAEVAWMVLGSVPGGAGSRQRAASVLGVRAEA